MARKKLISNILHDMDSTAVNERKHQLTMEKVTYETRRNLVLQMLILALGVALAVIITTTALRIFSGA